MFYDQQLPQYAIHSHTWSQDLEDEVLYADVGNDLAWSKPAFARGASECYAYLEDVSAVNYLKDVSFGLKEHLPTYTFSKSRWFTRRWTLQELLAPKNVTFFGMEWTHIDNEDEESTASASGMKGYLGTKYIPSLISQISQVIGIDIGILEGVREVGSASVAQRMSWAARRKTTRLEDEAYCLMGIFSVNMPLLYGEGRKAFLRLQEEILRQTDDESIFAWVTGGPRWRVYNESYHYVYRGGHPYRNDYHGLLANSTEDFAESQAIITQIPADAGDDDDDFPWSMTNRGLRLGLPLDFCGRHLEPGKRECVTAALKCRWRNSSDFVGKHLRRTNGTNQYARIRCRTLERVARRGNVKTVCVRQAFPNMMQAQRSVKFAFDLKILHHSKNLNSTNSNFMVKQMISQEGQFRKDSSRSYYTPSKEDLLGALLIRDESHQKQFVLMLSLDQRRNVNFDAVETTIDSCLEDLQHYATTFNPRTQLSEFTELKIILDFAELSLRTEWLAGDSYVLQGRSFYKGGGVVSEATRETFALHERSFYAITLDVLKTESSAPVIHSPYPGEIFELPG